MKTDIILCGVGGQGILTIATIIGQAAMNENLYIKQAQVLVDAGGGDGALALQNCPNAVVQGMSFKNAIRTTSNGTDAHAYGGGLALLFSGGVVVENCAFENNKVSSAQKKAYGGGVGLLASTATIRGCRFIEFKLNGSAEAALKQIEDKGYAKPYAADNRKVIALGINFSSEKGTIDGFLTKEL